MSATPDGCRGHAWAGREAVLRALALPRDALSAGPAAVRRAGVLLLGLVLLAVGSMVGPWSPATPALAEGSSQASTPAVTVTLTQVSPLSPTTKDTVTITGTVKNTGTKPISQVQAYLWRSTDPLPDASALSQALSSEAGNPVGRRMLGTGNIFNITTVGTEASQSDTQRTSLAPGESVPFTVKGTVNGAGSLGFLAGSTYLMGVQVRGVPQGGVDQTLGRARTLQVVQPATGTAATRAAAVVLLNSRPSLLRGSQLSDDHLATELGGRLATLLTLAKRSGTTLLLDPALYDELEVMSKGYTVRGSSRTQASQLRTGQQRATAFLKQLQPLLSTGRAYRTLYGSPDVEAAVATGHTAVLTSSATLASGHALAGLPLAVLPADGQVGEQGLQAIAALKPSVVLAANLSSSTTVQQAQGTSIVRVQEDAFDGAPAPEPTTTAPQVAGRLQAEEKLSSSPMVAVVDTVAEAQALQASAPWRTLVPVTQLVQAAAAERPTARVADAPDMSGAASWFSPVGGATEELQAWGELVVDDSSSTTLVQRAQTEGISTAWHGSSTAQKAWLQALVASTGSVLQGNSVRLSVVSSFITSSSSQDIPVTISNSLSEPVRVKVAFLSENPQRISVADSPMYTVAAGDSDTVKVHVTARANGSVGVTASLATAQGQLIGQQHQLTITATRAGRVGWIIVIASGTVLLAGTALRIRQVQRERRVGERPADTADFSGNE